MKKNMANLAAIATILSGVARAGGPGGKGGGNGRWHSHVKNASKLSCEAATFADMLPGSASIEKTALVESGSEYGEGAADIGFPTNPTNLPGLCAITVNVTSSETSSYRFGLFLPTDSWNSRFLTVGNSGFAGGINWLDMGSGVRYGFASMSTDTGHNSTAGDLTWAVNSPGQRTDFGWRAMHGSVMLAKEMVELYYGTCAEYAYYAGCSTGGRQGLKEAEMFPDDFDGVLAGAPAWWTSHLQTWTTKLGAYNLPAGAENHIPTELFDVIEAEAIKQCDSLDGLQDGIISSPELCDFDTSALLCGSGDINTSSCLTEAQVETANNVYADYYPEGEFGFPGLSISSEWEWHVLLGGDTPSSLGDGYTQYMVLNDPSWNWTQYNDSILWIADEMDPGNMTADKYDLSEFKATGGKALLYHGMSDGYISTGSSTYFYEQASAATEGLSDFLKLFLVPGMGHCASTATDAPWYFAGAGQTGRLGTDVFSTPGFEADPMYDALMALVEWVENGSEPELIATTWEESMDPSSGVLRQRPLCAYPQKAIYDGKGDVDSVDSWSCQE
ncbi:uncharacterized protein MKZ38_003971 [Zalerion maritima]|uniref:Carboxylic ester hydrolase n=1 Tax=Zalerion maritima TaxID=339359 RepID=A0AAD5RM45_9PEZI|nr:uncharacterized protein MKZ38_003971 [Zalerion maritima]